MKKLLLIYFVILSFLTQNSYTQISFIGFDQDQCGLISDHGYSFENISMMCGSHSSGYKIYSDGNKIFEKCIDFGGCSILELMFINKSTGFLIEANNNGHTIYKTINSGTSWISIGGGAPTFLGFYIVNLNTGYLITTWDNPLNLYITRVSDISSRFISDSNINNDFIITDTIFGISSCDIDTLSFMINNINDTIRYHISFINEPLSIANILQLDNFNIFPNPTFDFIEISKDFILYDGSLIKILDINGRIARTFTDDLSRLYIGDLKKGIYIIEMTDKNRRLTHKIIKL